MKHFMSVGGHLSGLLETIGAVMLAGMMFLTTLDVLMRYLGKPFMGAYELVSMAGAIVIGFGIPETTRQDANVRVDFLVEGASAFIKTFFFIFTRLLGIALFVFMGWGLITKAIELQSVNEASLTLRMPLYPVGYGLGVCAFIEAFVLASLLLKGLYTKEVAHE